MNLDSNCLATFLLSISDSLALPDRNDANIIRNSQNATRAFQANTLNVDFKSALEEELISLEQSTVISTLFEIFLIVVLIAVIAAVFIGYITLSFDFGPALLLTLVVVVCVILAFLFIFSLLNNRQLPVVGSSVLSVLEEGAENQVNTALCAYSGKCSAQ